VYWVAHVGDSCTAAYGWQEFELEPATDPCPECKGTGIDWTTSHETSRCTPCSTCRGAAERQPPPPTPVSVYEHMKHNIEDTKS
jgi:DnaJ-class molecular chaperone